MNSTTDAVLKEIALTADVRHAHGVCRECRARRVQRTEYGTVFGGETLYPCPECGMALEDVTISEPHPPVKPATKARVK